MKDGENSDWADPLTSSSRNDISRYRERDTSQNRRLPFRQKSQTIKHVEGGHYSPQETRKIKEANDQGRTTN